jgi:hypothetical protein
LENLSEAPVASSIIVDGAAIVQMLKPAGAKNFAALELHLKRAAYQGGHMGGVTTSNSCTAFANQLGLDH